MEFKANSEAQISMNTKPGKLVFVQVDDLIKGMKDNKACLGTSAGTVVIHKAGYGIQVWIVEGLNLTFIPLLENVILFLSMGVVFQKVMLYEDQSRVDVSDIHFVSEKKKLETKYYLALLVFQIKGNE